MFDRRRFVVGIASAVAAPWLAHAQAKPPRIAVLIGDQANDAVFRQAFQRGLREYGYTEGRNILVQWSSATGHHELSKAASALVRANPDVIVAAFSPAVQAAKEATSKIPIVMFAGDAVGTGFVKSLARPSGNITGVSVMLTDLGGKLLEHVRALRPNVNRVAIVVPVDDALGQAFAKQFDSISVSGLSIRHLALGREQSFDAVFSELGREGITTAILLPRLATKDAAQAALKHRVAAFTTGIATVTFPKAGGLLGYGPDTTDAYRLPAGYVDRILKGAKPGEMPVEQPTKFLLAVNLQTARILGITPPNDIVLRADEVIR